MVSSELAHRYFACVGAQDIDGFTALFAEDATMALPDGREFTGKPAIRAMQLGVFAHGKPKPTPVTILAGDGGLAVEVSVQLPDGGTRQTGNFFQIDDRGLIRRLTIYRRG